MPHRQLDIRYVDFSDAEEVKNFAILLFSAANEKGVFLALKQYDKAREGIKQLARDWVCRVEKCIDSMSVGDALTVIASYDIVHRIAFGIPARVDYLDKYRLKAFEAYVHGDRSVDQYILFQIVSHEIRMGNKTYFGRPLEWESLCIDRWYNNFRTGLSASSQSNYDTLHQVKALLMTDLYAFTPHQEDFKRKLIANYGHLDALAGMDCRQIEN
ncbi:MAG: hypothetical protein K2L91_06105 [Duncaniella sp.]|nr:hypothetical protein [Duncaniella sp.]MDE6328082.1 hypothetical protein [Duncaniella sp.]MDE6572032.1 hypothetical protein [Duncaniella sp.]